MTRNIVSIVVAGWVVLTCQAVLADGAVTFRYDTIYDQIQEMQTKLQPLSDVKPILKVRSTACDVRLSDVTLELQSSGKPAAKVPVDGLGDVALPLTPTFYRQGYVLVSNQQHGLAYDVKMHLDVSRVDLSYKDLQQLEADYRQGLRSVGGFIAYHVMVPQGLVFVYAGGDASLVLTSQKGDKTLVAEPAGGYHGLPDGARVIRLPLDPDADDPGARIHLQRAPDAVDVSFSPDIEESVAKQEASDSGHCKP